MITITTEDLQEMYGSIGQDAAGAHLCSCACNCSCHCRCGRLYPEEPKDQNWID
ncbi:hypothetical protein AALA69_08325 [Eggerthellaceae bacterium 24-137]